MYKSKLYYNQPQKFTQYEIDWVNDLADAVCFVFGVTVGDLAGNSRKAPLPDARRIISYYCYHNIKLDNVQAPNNVALASWFLKVHHSVVCYHVKTFDGLYMSDSNFKAKYDAVLSIMNGNEVVMVREEIEVPTKKLTWEDVRSNSRYTMQIKESLMPVSIAHKIRSMRECGYSPRIIANYVKCGEAFAKWYIDKNGIQVSSRARLFSNSPSDAYSAPRYQSKVIDY